MNIIALFLHILWDRKCKELLIPISEAETVVCFCFQMAPDSDLPTAKPERGDCVVTGVHGHMVWVHIHRQDICTQTTHHTHTRRTHSETLSRMLLSPKPTCTPSIKRNPTLSPTCARPHQVHCNYLSMRKPNQTRTKIGCYLRK